MPFWCGHCGLEKPVKLGYLPADPRFAIVRCGGYDRPATSDQKAAQALVEQRAARAAAALQAKAEEKERRKKEIEKERRAAFGQ